MARFTFEDGKVVRLIRIQQSQTTFSSQIACVSCNFIGEDRLYSTINIATHTGHTLSSGAGC